MTRKRIEQLLAQHTPRIRSRFRKALQRVKDRWTVAKLESALEGGPGAPPLSAVLDDVEGAAKLIAAQSEAVTVLVAQEVATQLTAKLDTIVSYDGTNERAVQALRANRLRMVQGLTDEARNTIGEALARGTEAGMNPRRQAVMIRDQLGLGDEQRRWIASYRHRLETLDRGALGMELRDARFDDTVDAAIKAKTPLPAAKVDKLVERYAARALRWRSELVARTETLSAVHTGMTEGYQQSIDAGILDADRLVCTWHAVGLPRSRHWHASMKGRKQPWGVPFVSGLGNLLKHPGDRNAPVEELAHCICAMSVRVYPSAEAAAAALAAA
jgi:hypothetical protein